MLTDYDNLVKTLISIERKYKTVLVENPNAELKQAKINPQFFSQLGPYTNANRPFGKIHKEFEIDFIDTIKNLNELNLIIDQIKNKIVILEELKDSEILIDNYTSHFKNRERVLNQEVLRLTKEGDT